MQRVRRAADVALALVVALCLSSLPAAANPLGRGVALAATVAWPVSTLVVSEVQTGGSSASDEFVEIANQGAGPVDLIGLEVVYATSSGSTVTRKATWSASTILSPGRRILVVNGVGSYVGSGDATYTGGFAATGGAIALRVVGGSVIDAVGWGDATNAFVEGCRSPRHLRHRAWSGALAAQPATRPTRTTTRWTGSSRACRLRRTSPRRPCPASRRHRRRRRAPRRHRVRRRLRHRLRIQLRLPRRIRLRRLCRPAHRRPLRR